MTQLPLKISFITVTYAFKLNHLKGKLSTESDVAALHVLPSSKCCTSQLVWKGTGSFSSYLWFPLTSVLLRRGGCPHSFRDAEWHTRFARVQNKGTEHYACSSVQLFFKTLSDIGKTNRCSWSKSQWNNWHKTLHHRFHYKWMGMETELVIISIHKAHIGKDFSALTAADVEAHSVPVLSFLQTEDLNLQTSWPGTICGLQDSSWNCAALITKVLLHQNQSVADR